MPKQNQPTRKLSAKRSRKKIISPKNTMKQGGAAQKKATSLDWYKWKSAAMGKRPRLHQ